MVRNGKSAGQDAEVVDLDHVGMAGLGEQADLVAEAREVLGVARLERDLERQRTAVGRAGAHAVDGGPRSARDLALEQDVPEQAIEMGEVEAGAPASAVRRAETSWQPRALSFESWLTRFFGSGEVF